MGQIQQLRRNYNMGCRLNRRIAWTRTEKEGISRTTCRVGGGTSVGLKKHASTMRLMWLRQRVAEGVRGSELVVLCTPVELIPSIGAADC